MIQKSKQTFFADIIDGPIGIILINPQLNMVQLETTFNPVHLIVTFFFRGWECITSMIIIWTLN